MIRYRGWGKGRSQGQGVGVWYEQLEEEDGVAMA